MNEINNSLTELILMRKKTDLNCNQILEYQYRSPQTGEIQYYTVIVCKARKIKLNEKIKSEIGIGTQIIACTGAQYCIINRLKYSDRLLLIPFSIHEGTSQGNIHKKKN